MRGKSVHVMKEGRGKTPGTRGRNNALHCTVRLPQSFRGCQGLKCGTLLAPLLPVHA